MSGRVGDDPATALREHLIDTAERLIAEVPVTSITTREIARAAAVSDGVLYNYFGDKNDLLVAALLRKYRSLVERFVARIPVAGSATIDENLAVLATALFDLANEFVPMVAGLVVDPVLFHRLFAAMHAEPFGPQQLQEPMLRYVEEEQRLGRIAPDVDRDSISLLLLGPTAMLALAVHVTSGGDRPAGEGSAVPMPPMSMLPPEATLRSLVDTLIRGLRAVG